jgi:putative oligomerization/nucleic acid binding protein
LPAGTLDWRQGHACGCRGSNGGKQDSASEARPHGEGRVAGTALDILDERFARGEIEKAEYEEKKQLISQCVAPPKVDVPDGDQSLAAARTEPRSAKQDAQRR